MKCNLLSATILALGLGFSGVSNAIILDFESFGLPGSGISSLGNVIVEDGFSLSTMGGFGLAVVNDADFRALETTSVFDNTPNAATVLEAIDGSFFDLLSIDLAELNTGNVADVVFTRDGGHSQTFTLDGTFGAAETFFFDSGFLNTTSVSFVQASPFHHFDNITLNIITENVPEPTTFTIFILGLIGLFANRFKRNT